MTRYLRIDSAVFSVVRRRLAAAVVMLTMGAAYQPAAQGLPISGTVTVKPWSVSETGLVTDPNIAQDILFADQIYGQIGISVKSLANGNLTATPPNGAGTTWTNTGNAITGAAGLFSNNQAGAVNVYYMPIFGSFGQAWANEDVGGGVSAVGAVVTQATALQEHRLEMPGSAVTIQSPTS